MPYLIALVAGVALLVGSFFTGYGHGEKHTQAAWDADRVAQAQTLAAAVAHTIEVQNAQEAATQAVQQDYEARLKVATDSSTLLSGLVRQYKNSLRASAVSALPAATGSAAPGAAIPAGDSGIDTAATNAIGACQDDAAQLSALIEWVKDVAK